MTVRILVGDARERLRQLADDSVDACVTSPPYFGLRTYLPDGHPKKSQEMGLEQTPQQYIEAMVDVFREVRRVLKPTGSLLINLGDSYANDGKWGGYTGGKHVEALHCSPIGRNKKYTGFKPKDLIGIPWAVAFALRDDGWWLRSDNIWAKPNGMPESTTDRPTRAHEYVFQLSKCDHYYFGYEDVKLPPAPGTVERLARSMREKLDGPNDPDIGTLVVSGGGYAPPGQPPHKGARRREKQRGHGRRHNGFSDRWDAMSVAEQQANGSALRSVWWIAPGGFPEAHFAVMPEELAATCVLASCPKGGLVLDPFAGAGTVGVVADRLDRNAILIELSEDYAEMAERRIRSEAPLFCDVTVEAAA